MNKPAVGQGPPGPPGARARSLRHQVRSLVLLSTGGLLLTGLVLGVAGAICLLWMREPTYGNHGLSEWLDAYDTNLRWPDEQRSGFTDGQVSKALDALAPKAPPVLLRWLRAENPRLDGKLNRWLQRQHWLRFRFPENRNRHSLAETGFMYYGNLAKPAQPALIEMTFSPDPQRRMRAYEGFFFTRPEKNLFLPVAKRALREPNQGIQAMAAQWMVERFPDEAEKAGLRKRFPQFHAEETGSPR